MALHPSAAHRPRGPAWRWCTRMASYDYTTETTRQRSLLHRRRFYKRYSVHCVIDAAGETQARGRIEHAIPSEFAALVKKWPGRVVFEASMIGIGCTSCWNGRCRRRPYCWPSIQDMDHCRGAGQNRQSAHKTLARTGWPDFVLASMEKRSVPGCSRVPLVTRTWAPGIFRTPQIG